MAGHGSPPDPDRALHPGRRVTADSGLRNETSEHLGVLTHISEFRVPGGTRFAWEVGERAEPGKGANIFAKGRGGGVSTYRRAVTATRSAARRVSEGRNLYTGR
jgi:hypothetical protein